MRGKVSKLRKDMFTQDPAAELFAYLQDHPEFSGAPEELTDLASLATYVKMLSLHHEAMYKDLDETELMYEVDRLRIRLIEQYVKFKKTQLSRALENADDGESQRILTKVRELDQLLKR